MKQPFEEHHIIKKTFSTSAVLEFMLHPTSTFMVVETQGKFQFFDCYSFNIFCELDRPKNWRPHQVQIWFSQRLDRIYFQQSNTLLKYQFSKGGQLSEVRKLQVIPKKAFVIDQKGFIFCSSYKNFHIALLNSDSVYSLLQDNLNQSRFFCYLSRKSNLISNFFWTLENSEMIITKVMSSPINIKLISRHKDHHIEKVSDFSLSSDEKSVIVLDKGVGFFVYQIQPDIKLLRLIKNDQTSTFFLSKFAIIKAAIPRDCICYFKDKSIHIVDLLSQFSKEIHISQCCFRASYIQTIQNTILLLTADGQILALWIKPYPEWSVLCKNFMPINHSLTFEQSEEMFEGEEQECESRLPLDLDDYSQCGWNLQGLKKLYSNTLYF